jgi:hypothetical protein
LKTLEARAQLGVAIGSLYPQTQEGAGAAQQNLLSSRLAKQANLQHSFANFNLGFDAAWELDFWGRFRRNVEANDANLLATVADYDSALVSLTAEVARIYALVRTYEELIQIARENAKVRKEGLDIAESRFRNGATSELDVTQARTLLESTLADIPPLQASLQQSKNALSTLLGRPPGAVEALLNGPHRIPSASKPSRSAYPRSCCSVAPTSTRRNSTPPPRARGSASPGSRGRVDRFPQGAGERGQLAEVRAGRPGLGAAVADQVPGRRGGTISGSSTHSARSCKRKTSWRRLAPPSPPI